MTLRFINQFKCYGLTFRDILKNKNKTNNHLTEMRVYTVGLFFTSFLIRLLSVKVRAFDTIKLTGFLT